MEGRPIGRAHSLALLGGVVRRDAADTAPAEALLIRDGRIAAVGDRDAVLAADDDLEIRELSGRTVMPAFTDAHTHFHRWTQVRFLHLDLGAPDITDLDAVLRLVRARAAARPPGTWIQGDSVNPGSLAEGRMPDRHELDAAAPQHPVVLRSLGKHVVAANSAALAAAGIDATTPDPPGGRLERDAAGVPTGVLHERGKLRLDQSDPDTVVPTPPAADRLAALRRGMAELPRAGITTIHEMIRLPEEVNDWSALWAAGELDVRIRLFYRVHETTLSLESLLDMGLRRGFGDPYLRVEGIKVSVDGWCLFRNAAVVQPYEDDGDNVGVLRIDVERLRTVVRRAREQGLVIALHAVGPRAVDMALDAFEAAGPPRGHQYRLEHAHVDIDRDRLARAKALGVVWSVQPGFLPDYRAGWLAGLGPERTDGIFRLRTGLELGLPLVIDSDVPSGPLGPIAAIRAAVDRRAGDATVGADEAIPLAAAWAAHSTVPAQVAGDGDGRLVAGAPADLIVLDRDPMDDDPALDDTHVVATMMAGRWRFDELA